MLSLASQLPVRKISHASSFPIGISGFVFGEPGVLCYIPQPITGETAESPQIHRPSQFAPMANIEANGEDNFSGIFSSVNFRPS